jgi:hypothetical protein
VQDLDVVAAVEVVVDEHLPVALHIVHHLPHPRQPGLWLRVEGPDLRLDAVSDVVERGSLETAVRLRPIFLNLGDRQGHVFFPIDFYLKLEGTSNFDCS